MSKNYQELSDIDDFEKRFEYLRLSGIVGQRTFGSNRYLNQKFYNSREWRGIREIVILRDGGYDMGHPDYPISGRIIVHHIDPITEDDLIYGRDKSLDPNNLISVSHTTSLAIHYGDKSLLPKDYVPRKPNDTVPWR